MKFKKLNGKEVKIDISSLKNPTKSRSKMQAKVGNILKEIFPRFQIIEEFRIPGTRFRIDFFIPEILLAVEVDGRQHDEFNKFFHSSVYCLIKSKQRDSLKSKWCDMNNISLVRIRDIKNAKSTISKAVFGE